MAEISDILGGAWEINVSDNDGVACHVDELSGPVVLVPRTGILVGLTAGNVDISLKPADVHGNIFGELYREEPPLAGVLHVIRDTIDGQPALAGACTIRTGTDGDIEAAYIEFIRKPQPGWLRRKA